MQIVVQVKEHMMRSVR